MLKLSDKVKNYANQGLQKVNSNAEGMILL
jgi:hypothetical protein